MDDKHAMVLAMLDDFTRTWGERFPRTPPPSVSALDSLKTATGQRSAMAANKWLTPGVVVQLRASVKHTEDKIAQLEEQLERSRYLRQFLLQVLQCLDGSATARATPARSDAIARQGFATFRQSPEQLPTHDKKRISLESERSPGVPPATPKVTPDRGQPCLTSQSRAFEKLELGAAPLEQTWPRCHKPEAVKYTHPSTAQLPMQRSQLTSGGANKTTGVRKAEGISHHDSGVAKQTSLSSSRVDLPCASRSEYVNAAVFTGTLSLSDMFRGRKGKVAPKRADEGQFDRRDNSAILGKRELITGLPVPCARLDGSMKGTFQYLKLTDGFNIVLSDTQDALATTDNQATGNNTLNTHVDSDLAVVSDDDEDPYDNNVSFLSYSRKTTMKSRPLPHGTNTDDSSVSTDDRGDDTSCSESAVCSVPNVSSSCHVSSASPATFRDPNLPAPVGVHTTIIKVTSVSPMSTLESRPRDGEKPPLPPLPAKQKPPSAFLYAPSVTSEVNSPAAGRGRAEARESQVKASESDASMHMMRGAVTGTDIARPGAHSQAAQLSTQQTPAGDGSTSPRQQQRDRKPPASAPRPDFQRAEDRVGATWPADVRRREFLDVDPGHAAASSAVQAVCLASFSRALGVTQIQEERNYSPNGGRRCSGGGSGDGGGGSEGGETPAKDMSKFSVHNLCAGGGEGEDQPRAVYRKLEEDPTAPAPYMETDIDADSKAPVVLREKHSAVAEVKPRRKSKENTYENWTIDRAVTQMVGLSDDDEDTDENASPYSTIGRQHERSRLSSDVGTSVSQLSPLASSDDRANDTADARLSNLSFIRKLNSLQPDDEDCVPVSPLPGDRSQDDRASLASDIVFFHGAERPESPQAELLESPQDGVESPQDRHPSGEDPETLPYCNNSNNNSSSCEDEHDSVDTSFDDLDGDAASHVSLSQRDNKLKMRHLLVCGVLDTERAYLAILELLLHYKRSLEASCRTSQPVISEDDINSIFGNLPQVFAIHQKFVEGLQDKVNNWSPEQTVGDVFKELVLMFPDFGDYVKGYAHAVATIHRCSQENTHFEDLAKQIVLTSTTREVTSLEDALFKPVQRLQRNTLVLHDLLKHTPPDHPDHLLLQKALHLSQYNLDNFDAFVTSNGQGEERRLVKSSFLVELISGSRKLRFIFLFNDLLVCTKRQQHRSGKVAFECKWYIPIRNLKLDTKFAYQDDMKFSRKDDIDDLKRKIRGHKSELKREMKKEEMKDKHWSISSLSSSRNIEKINKKISELEAQLILASPRLPFKVTNDPDKWHTLLMTTDYEREEWRETITSLLKKTTYHNQPMLSAYEVQEIVNSVRELPQVNKIGTVLLQTDEDAIFGTLNVTIHKLNGLQEPCDTYCCLEMDSFGHFFMKARTNICQHSVDPAWNEDFELDLEGSQTLRILCYRKGPETEGDVLLGRGALEMSKSWLKGTFQEKNVVMNEYSLVVSVRYTAAEKTMRRTPSKQTTAVFGVKIGVCARREGKTVPTLIAVCVQEVEKRGMTETGIYRVSGVTSDVQKVKKMFDKNVKSGAAIVADIDIHTVTGVLKLYLRELPEPLFTEASYQHFIDALKLSDGEAKERCMLSLLHNLPDTNYYTAVFLLEHLMKVVKHVGENKMTVHNLSTIFGPTLLAPAVKESQVSPMDMMSKGAEQVMKQSAIVHYFLNLLTMGGSLRRSSAPVS